MIFYSQLIIKQLLSSQLWRYFIALVSDLQPPLSIIFSKEIFLPYRSSAAPTLNEWSDSSPIWFRTTFFCRSLKIWLIDAGVRENLEDRFRLKLQRMQPLSRSIASDLLEIISDNSLEIGIIFPCLYWLVLECWRM